MVRVRVIDEHTGRPVAAKLTFVGRHGSATPRLSLADLPVRHGEALAAYNRVFAPTGVADVPIPHGQYDLAVNHGPEWTELIVSGVTVSEKAISIEAPLSHVADLPGWVSADLHVHAAPSWDSVVPLEARAAQFIADGVDVLVATDHNLATDYGAAVHPASAGHSLSAISGSELTTDDWGHFGVFPLEPDPTWEVLAGRRVRGKTPERLIAQVRARAPEALVSVNHPRLGKMGYFTLGSFEDSTAKSRRMGATEDFDAVEILNGYQDANMRFVDVLLRDWFALLGHGRRVTAVGNSDTHHLHGQPGGYPRNYVQVGSESPSGPVLARALRAGKSFFTTGPMLELELQGGGIGDTVRAERGNVAGRVRVRAAPWVDVSRVRIYLGGEVAADWAVKAGAAALRFERQFELAVARDSFLVVRVDGKRPLGPSVAPTRGAAMLPIAISNPVFVDGNGDGQWRPQ